MEKHPLSTKQRYLAILKKIALLEKRLKKLEEKKKKKIIKN